ncbi:hypothetical protein HOP51_04165 [Halomonas sp. MCCC 1A11036]|uniref:Uncharacterized protein n=1 Tax=Billgrantia zhangzhouensis TaxID=2733481 RepID=A0ABS9ACK3_9GAMM|nr:hypothetical protein [Halomonas zhangzhouensis]MCE8019317.1 hypothetical protein [Halomonas zhangzhouensis]
MDLLNIIKSKVQIFQGTGSQQGLEAVVHHIEIAESHFGQSKNLGEHLYTDVIYRSNQAFEGALKEAYRVLKGEDPSKLSPYKIEKHLESEGILKERVLSQLTNYRTEWRNKSTHDYQLFFSSQEAMLAIVSVSAFFSILLDQMMEKHFYETEKARLSKVAKSLFEDVPDYGSMEFIQQCVELVTHFGTELQRDKPDRSQLKEQELLGKLSGFIAASDPQIRISTEKPINYASGRLRVDMLLEKGDDAVILELKNSPHEWRRRAREGVEQLRHYLIASELSHGIVFIPALRPGWKHTVNEQSIDAPHGKLHIAVVAPDKE